jgi:hypothetical protein
MEFITQNNVLMEGHNRLVRITSKRGLYEWRHTSCLVWVDQPFASC